MPQITLPKATPISRLDPIDATEKLRSQTRRQRAPGCLLRNSMATARKISPTQQQDHREVEAREHRGVHDRKRGEQRAAARDQPDLVAVPHRTDGVQKDAPLLVGARRTGAGCPRRGRTRRARRSRRAARRRAGTRCVWRSICVRPSSRPVAGVGRQVVVERAVRDLLVEQEQEEREQQRVDQAEQHEGEQHLRSRHRPATGRPPCASACRRSTAGARPRRPSTRAGWPAAARARRTRTPTAATASEQPAARQQDAGRPATGRSAPCRSPP